MTRQRVDICTAWQKVSGVFKAPAVLAVAILLSLSGCGKESHAPGTVRDSAPANVMLVLGSPSVKSGEDYNSIRSIRIYAFRNGSSADTQPVGYFYNADVNGEGPFYCPVDLSESGRIDFLVLLNDNRIETGGDFNDRNESTTRSQLEDITFTGIDRGEDDSIGPIVPMCNERITGAGIDANNFTFTVEENSDWQIIPVDVKRSVGKAMLKLAKSGEIDVNVTNVTLRKGPVTAPLVLQDDVINATGYYYYETNNDSETLINTAVELADGEPATIAETLLLPNPYGSSHADRFEAEYNNYDSVDRTYRLDITYTVRPHDTSQTTTTTKTTKTVFLPQVRANENLIIEGTISSRVTSSFEIVATAWTEKDMSITFD